MPDYLKVFLSKSLVFFVFFLTKLSFFLQVLSVGLLVLRSDFYSPDPFGEQDTCGKEVLLE